MYNYFGIQEDYPVEMYEYLRRNKYKSLVYISSHLENCLVEERPMYGKLREFIVIPNHSLAHYAIKNGYVNCLKYIFENGYYEINNSFYELAIKYNQLGILKYIHFSGKISFIETECKCKCAIISNVYEIDKIFLFDGSKTTSNKIF